MESYWLFKTDKQGGGVAWYVRERLDCSAFATRDDTVESLWVRIKRVDSKTGVVMGVYY